MLHVLFTRSKVIAGAEIDGEIQLLHFHNQTYLEQPGQSPFKNLDAYLADLVGAYHGVIGEKRDQAIPLAYATPVDVSSAERAQLRVKLSKLAQPASFELIHEDNLAVCYLLGVLSEQDMDLNGAAILDAQEQHTNVCLFKPGEDLQGEALMKANDPFKGENFEVYPLKDFGPSAGKERVLSELLRAFADAGMKVKVKGQTDLAIQLEEAYPPYVFQITQETERITLAGEVRLKDAEYNDLITHNRERLNEHLNARRVKQNKIVHVALLGEYLHQDAILNYLKQDLKLGDALILGGKENEDHTYYQMVLGLMVRSGKVRELHRLKAEEEAHRAKIEAEIKAKEGRESLLERLEKTCIDPAKKEEYEAEFVPRGEELGIPGVVIKWNISEALNRISLAQEASKAGLQPEPEQQPKAPTPKKKSQNGSEAVKKKKTPPPVEKTPPPKPEPVAEPEPQPVAKTEPVLSGVEAQPVGGGSAPMTAVAEPKVESNLPVKAGSQKRQPSLSALFILGETIDGEEFPSRKATFKGDSVVKLIRLLPQDQRGMGDHQSNFEKLYQKELAYYGDMGEISELSEAKEGLYYFRDFVERATLADFVSKSGLDKKSKVEDLGSEDLKFILQVFKSVQELEQSHSQLNEQNILVLNKRRGLLRRGGGQADIRFVGFTSEDATPAKMVEDTHAAFSRILGEQFYASFRKQFQL